VLRRRDGSPILDWKDWEPPKEDYQWKAGRSAMEFARAWFTSPGPVVPKEFRNLLDSHPLTRSIQLEEGFPELVTPLPERGEGRNHDLALKGTIGDRRVTICIEAKVDELFGDNTVGDYWLAATKNRDKPEDRKPTRVPERIETLLRLVFGGDANPDHFPWGKIRYQLLSGLGGTVLQAIRDESHWAVFAVHEFHTLEISREKVTSNMSDFEHVVRTLFRSHDLDVEVGRLYGPIRIDPRPIGKTGVELFLGKCVDEWRIPRRT